MHSRGNQMGDYYGTPEEYDNPSAFSGLGADAPYCGDCGFEPDDCRCAEIEGAVTATGHREAA